MAYLLIEEGSDPNYYEDRAHVTPLHYAVVYNSTQVVPILISAGANPNASDAFGSTPLDDAKALGRKEIKELIVKCSKLE